MGVLLLLLLLGGPLIWDEVTVLLSCEVLLTMVESGWVDACGGTPLVAVACWSCGTLVALLNDSLELAWCQESFGPSFVTGDTLPSVVVLRGVWDADDDDGWLADSQGGGEPWQLWLACCAAGPSSQQPPLGSMSDE
ncbi:hypothetical protein EJ03DRAFT_36684 [Teratosphaeria nubilosa]|uniref:Secreted protein n=1 Tax=Teratosphaeria nubilosa TaxID=161662 RepID=A0A6G1LED0_9PEZI|nr:hypothetical protein EJ03DRAFT_36684 [Teratosphaeria nubilosa]